ncbi:hypothetical protein [Thiomonas delicata]|uniref:DUF1640 domain-containing protein n=1 Tax=Thiomonas delicata TaxID=364030 RepID=A0A238D765_THIDL|nr:hypothetical protein [Thiomonas delicata]SBP89069.1 hypothetical protein THIARS_70689 [Thiomonas delicata]
MNTMNLAMEIFEAIEGQVGHDQALRVAKSVDAAVVRIEEKAREHSLARKVEIKDELKQELRDELSTKVDLANTRSELKQDIANLRAELKQDIADLRAELKQDIANIRSELKDLKLRTTVQFLITIFVIVMMNQNALALLGKLLGLVK